MPKGEGGNVERQATTTIGTQLEGSIIFDEAVATGTADGHRTYRVV